MLNTSGRILNKLKLSWKRLSESYQILEECCGVLKRLKRACRGLMQTSTSSTVRSECGLKNCRENISPLLTLYHFSVSSSIFFNQYSGPKTHKFTSPNFINLTGLRRNFPVNCTANLLLSAQVGRNPISLKESDPVLNKVKRVQKSLTELVERR